MRHMCAQPHTAEKKPSDKESGSQKYLNAMDIHARGPKPAIEKHIRYAFQSESCQMENSRVQIKMHGI